MTKIEWTDYSFNPWWGCVRVSPACRFCYADRDATRYGMQLWRHNGERRMLSDNHWRQPLKWNWAAEQAGRPALVFCASMADVFEDRRDLDAPRERLWQLIADTPWLTWQLLTKRPENAARLTPWGDNWPDSVWLGTSVENQRFADQRIPHLLDVPAKIRFLSCEPLLGPVALGRVIGDLDWIISGGESGPKARPSHPDWFRSLRDQCAMAGVPYHHKQWGRFVPEAQNPQALTRASAGRALYIELDGSTRPAAFGARGNAVTVQPVGKARSGRRLDGRIHDDMPARHIPEAVASDA